MCVCVCAVSCLHSRPGDGECVLSLCFSRPAGKAGTGFFNHNTNTFIHLKNTTINFSALRDLREI